MPAEASRTARLTAHPGGGWWFHDWASARVVAGLTDRRVDQAALLGRLPRKALAVAAEQIREAEAWWRTNRSKAPNAIREELERASALIATQPDIGSRARNVTLGGVRRIHLGAAPLHRRKNSNSLVLFVREAQTPAS